MNFQPIEDHYIIEVERIYETTQTKAGIFRLNDAYIDDQDMDRYEHKRIYGTVVAVPAAFSDKSYRPIDTGEPAYRAFIGHEHIVDKINRGYNKSHDVKTYYPSTFEKYPSVTFADIGARVNVAVGERVYFVPQVTEHQNFQGKAAHGGLLYRMMVTDIFAARQRGKIRTQGEWVLIKPNTETWEEITTPSGIIKKPQPERKYLEGTVAISHHDHCKEGMKILYVRDADCEVKINDEVYFLMPINDVLGELK